MSLEHGGFMKWSFKSEKLVDRGSTRFTATTDISYDRSIAEWLDRKTMDVLIDKVTDLWIEQHGAELLAQITPEDVEKRVKQNIAERVLKA